MYDVIIIGAGPAGLSAALNLKLHNKSFLWFGSAELSQKVERSEKIANYPGVPMASGEELNRRFRAQAEALGIAPVDKLVTGITANRGAYMVLADNDIYNARTIILTVGATSAKGIPGERELLGRGVSYCATCDGFLYAGKHIAVYCGDKRFEHEAAYLAEIAARVTLFTAYRCCELELPNIERLSQPVARIEGERRVESIVLRDGAEMPVDGVFILRGSIAPATLLKGLEMDGPHIAVNRRCETSCAGCFAAGDCTGRPYQIAKAVGEGNVAAHSALEYLAAAVKTADAGSADKQ